MHYYSYYNNYTQNYTQHIKSYIRTILFILFFILSTAINSLAEDKPDTTVIPNKQQAKPSESIRLGLRIGTTFHEPFYHTGYYWNRYFTTGIHLDLPTYIPRMLIHFSAEAGLLDKRDGTVKDVKIIHSSISLSYNFPIVKEKFSVRPRVGLSNIFISTTKLKDIVEGIVKDFEVFGYLENEFGIIGGIEPVYWIKRFQITMPITGNIAFSSPNPIITANVSLTAGVVF